MRVYLDLNPPPPCISLPVHVAPTLNPALLAPKPHCNTSCFAFIIHLHGILLPHLWSVLGMSTPNARCPWSLSHRRKLLRQQSSHSSSSLWYLLVGDRQQKDLVCPRICCKKFLRLIIHPSKPLARRTTGLKAWPLAHPLPGYPSFGRHLSLCSSLLPPHRSSPAPRCLPSPHNGRPQS